MPSTVCNSCRKFQHSMSFIGNHFWPQSCNYLTCYPTSQVNGEDRPKISTLVHNDPSRKLPMSPQLFNIHPITGFVEVLERFRWANKSASWISFLRAKRTTISNLTKLSSIQHIFTLTMLSFRKCPLRFLG